MSTDFDPAPLRPPDAPLQYFQDHDSGWDIVLRLVLVFAMLHAGTRAAGSLTALLSPMAGGAKMYRGFFGWPLTLMSQLLLPLAILIACVFAWIRRSRAARLWIVWCELLWIAWLLFVAVYVEAYNVSTSARGTSSSVGQQLYLVSSMLGSMNSALLPALIVVVLMRREVRRRFGDGQGT